MNMRPEVKELFGYLEEVLRMSGNGIKISVEDFVNKACGLCYSAFRRQMVVRSDDPFSYFASSSFGISEYPVYSFEARVNYIKELTSFSALYANKISVKCPFETYIAEQAFSEDMWLYIIPEITMILMLKPLADMDILEMKFEYFHLQSSLKPAVLTLEAILREEFAKSKGELMKFMMTESDVRLGKFENGNAWIKIEGPENLIYEGTIYLHGNLPSSLSKFAEVNKLIRVSDDVKSRILAKTINEIGTNAFHGRYYGELYGDSFISHMSSEIEMFSGEKSDYGNDFEYLTRLPHHLTYLRNISPYQMIEFREYEGEAFENYREHMRKLMQENIHIKDIDAAIKDSVQKDIDEIEKAIKIYKSKAKTGVKNELVSVGVYTIAGCALGGFDWKIAALLSALKAPELLRNSVEKISTAITIPEEYRQRPSYFLWSLKNTYLK